MTPDIDGHDPTCAAYRALNPVTEAGSSNQADMGSFWRAPQKTQLLDFRRPLRSRGEGRSPTAFDFLGFCWYWRRTRRGNWSVTCKTRRARLARAIKAVHTWCRANRHLPVRQQHAALSRRVQGHINYFGVNGNMPSLTRFTRQVTRSWFKWLNRRSQRARLNWDRFKDLLRDFPLPQPRIVVKIWR